jgi:hypothetical protein
MATPKKSIWAKKPTLFLLFILVTAGLIGSAVFTFKTRNNTFVAPRVGPIVESVYGLGTIKSHKQYSFRPGVGLYIEKLHVVEGDTVEEGQLLMTFDNGNRLKAPFTGLLTSIAFHENELVPMNAKMMTLEDPADVYLEVTLDQQAALRVKKNMECSLVFESIRNKKFKGLVENIYPKENQFIVHITPVDLPEEVLIGMTADVAIVVAKNEKALLVPALAISNGRVLVKRNNKRIKVSVDVNIMDDQWAEIVGDAIKESDLVFVKGAP